MKHKFNVNLLSMVKWKHFSLNQKYGLVLSITMILFIISTCISYLFLQHIKDNVTLMKQHGDTAINITEMGSLFRANNSLISDYIISPDNKTIKRFHKNQQDFKNLQMQLKKSAITAESQHLLNEINISNQQMTLIFLKQIIPSISNNDLFTARRFKNQADSLSTISVLDLQKLRVHINTDRTNAVHNVILSISKTIIILIGTVLGSLILGVIITIFIGYFIKKELKIVIQAANEISSGNLTTTPLKENNGRGEMSQLTRAINQMLNYLKDMVRQIYHAAEDVNNHSEALNVSVIEASAASQQISATMQELSSGAENQATSANQAANYLTDYINKISSEAQNSESLRDTSNNILTTTHEGSALMNDSINQMTTIYDLVKTSVIKVQGLDQHTQSISKLVKVIQDISDQTNLLSLNAAIEAARAGEHGKGFAVVAKEVRKLATEVSHSVSEITQIVTGIQNESYEVGISLQKGYEQVDKGTTQLKRTGLAFDGIQHSVQNMVKKIQAISDHLNLINNDSRELASTIGHIASISEESSAGIEQTSTSSIRTSHTIEEIKTNSEQLSRLSENLRNVVSQFQL